MFIGFCRYGCCSRSKSYFAVIAQAVEHRLGKTKVISANLINGSSFYAKVVQWQNTAFVKRERESDSRLWLQNLCIDNVMTL